MMADRTGSLFQSSTTGPSGRTIVAFVASYVLSYLLLGLFLVLEQVYSGRVYQVYTPPIYDIPGNVIPGVFSIDRPHDGPYIIVVTLMMFLPVLLSGFLLGWITGRRSVRLVIFLVVLYVFPGLMLALWDFPSSAMVGWDVPSDESITPVLTYYMAYLTLICSVVSIPAAYLASRIRNRISPISQQRAV